jgi:hypothetical protein
MCEQTAYREPIGPHRFIPGELLAESATKNNGVPDENILPVLEMGIERAAPDMGSLTDLPDTNFVEVLLEHERDQGGGELAARMYRA